MKMLVIALWVSCGILSYFVFRTARTVGCRAPWTTGERMATIILSLLGPIFLATAFITWLIVGEHKEARW